LQRGGLLPVAKTQFNNRTGKETIQEFKQPRPPRIDA
jgi:hypothetical protein